MTANYESYSQYKEYGLGVCILTGGEVVAGISSYSGYGRRSDENLGCHGGIEIEVVTREDYRRKGLAYIGARGCFWSVTNAGFIQTGMQLTKCQ